MVRMRSQLYAEGAVMVLATSKACKACTMALGLTFLPGCFNGELAWEALPADLTEDVSQELPPDETGQSEGEDAEQYFVISASQSQVVAGISPTVTVTVTDAQGNRLTDYTGSIELFTNDPQIPSSQSYTFAATDFGQASFLNLSLKTAGSWDIFIREIGSAATTSVNFQVEAAGPASAEFVGGYSTSWIAGASSGGVLVNVRDSFGNLAGTGDSVALKAYDANCSNEVGTISTANISNGVAPFSSLSYPTVGTVKLRAMLTSASVASDCSDAIQVSAAPSLAYSSATISASVAVQFSVSVSGLFNFTDSSAPIFDIIPTLPSGVNFDSSTGTIYSSSGPNVASAATDYTVTVNTGSGESATTVVNIEVLDPPRSLEYHYSGGPISPGGTLTLERGKDIASLSISPTYLTGVNPVEFTVSGGSLPSNIELDEDDGALTGTPAAAQAATAVVITVSNEDGAVSFSFYIQVIEPLFELKTNFGENLTTNQDYVVLSGSCLSSLGAVVSGSTNPWSFNYHNVTDNVSGNLALLAPAWKMADDDCSNGTGTWSMTPFVFPEANKDYELRVSATVGSQVTERRITVKKIKPNYELTLNTAGAGVPITYFSSTSAVTLSGYCDAVATVTVMRSTGDAGLTVSCTNNVWTSGPLSLSAGINSFRVTTNNGGPSISQVANVYQCATTPATDISGAGASGSSRQITTPAELADLAGVNSAVTYNVQNNIDLQCLRFPTISTFSGILQSASGSHFSITNFTSPTTARLGFISSLSGGTIKNVSFHQFNSDYSAEGSSTTVGLLFGSNASSVSLNLENLNVSGRLAVTGNSYGVTTGFVGGKLQGPTGGPIKNIAAFGEVTSDKAYLGGVIGEVSGVTLPLEDINSFTNVVSTYAPASNASTSVQMAYVGGIVGKGQTMNALSHHFTFSGNVYSASDYATHFGGICGTCGSASADPFLKQARVSGNILTKGKVVGGIGGANVTDNNIRMAWSGGRIIGADKVGGILGERAATKSSMVESSHSSAKIRISTGGIVGGLIGYVSEIYPSITNSYFNGTIEGASQSSPAGLLVGKTSSTCTDNNPIVSSSAYYSSSNYPDRLVGSNASNISAFTYCFDANSAASSTMSDFTDGSTHPPRFTNWTWEPTNGPWNWVSGSLPNLIW